MSTARFAGKVALVTGAGIVTFVYVADPEGNVVDLQHGL